MKKLILIIALMFAVATQAQDTWAVSVAQDFKLLVQDDDHGNTAPTLDIIVKLERQFLQREVGYLVFYTQAELADLDAGFYSRYAFGAGYSFNTLLKNFVVGFSYNYGWIRRFDDNFFGSEVQVEAAYRVYKGLSLVALCSYSDRIDIGTWRANAYFGLKYDF